MGFYELPDGTGKIFIPEKAPEAKQKHPCPDCFSCQMCSDDRCDQCRRCMAAGRCLKKKEPERGSKE